MITPVPRWYLKCKPRYKFFGTTDLQNFVSPSATVPVHCTVILSPFCTGGPFPSRKISFVTPSLTLVTPAIFTFNAWFHHQSPLPDNNAGPGLACGPQRGPFQTLIIIIIRVQWFYTPILNTAFNQHTTVLQYNTIHSVYCNFHTSL